MGRKEGILHYFELQKWVLSCLLWLWSALAHSGAVLDAVVTHNDGRFILHSEILINVSAERVRAILTEYENLARINGGIKKVNILERRADGVVRMHVDAGVCILFICREYTWIQNALTLPSGDIVTTIDPRESSFREGQVRYQIIPDGDNTRLITDADLVPDIWFPPVVGPWLIKRKLYEETLETARGVERIASQE